MHAYFIIGSEAYDILSIFYFQLLIITYNLINKRIGMCTFLLGTAEKKSEKSSKTKKKVQMKLFLQVYNNRERI
jgi:hypothetical protein